MQSDVVITGYRLNAKEPAQKALERILGLTPDAARRLARSFPAVVVQGAANDNAERIRTALENAGALVELRASGRPLERAPRDLPAAGSSFDLDLDLPMGGGGGGPAKANKGGTGSFTMPTRHGGLGAPRPQMNTDSLMPVGYVPPKAQNAFAAPPKTGTGAFAAPSKTGTGAFAAPAKTGNGPFAPSPKTGTGSLGLPPERTRAPQPTSRNPGQPPPPPPAAYQLGDFGVAPRGQSVVAKLPTSSASLTPVAPPPSSVLSMPTLADGDFDFESGGPSSLELDLGASPRQSLVRKPSQPLLRESSREDVLGERFGALAGAGSAKAPEIDVPALRAVQRRPDSRRPVEPGLLQRLLDGPWLSMLALLALCAITMGAVGYAFDPADPFAGLARARALKLIDSDDEGAHQQGYMHPLLRNTPRALRAPVAAVLRAQVPGVNDLPVSFPASAGQMAQCTLVQHGPELEARLARVRATGHEVEVTPSAAAEMAEAERALRAENARPDLQFTRVCLVP